MKVLFHWPNTSNRARIHMAMPVLKGIAKKMGWDYRYFDTSFYEKGTDSTVEKENTGSFKPAPIETLPVTKSDKTLVSDFQKIIDDYKPDVLAITAMTDCYQYLMGYFPKIKIPNNTTVVIGGTHSLHNTNEILKTGLFDISAFGQGEKIFPEILKRVEKNENMTGIPGTSTIDDINGKIVINPVSPALDENDLWAVEPDYSSYDARYYNYPFDGKKVNMFWLEVGRGCPYACTYCEAPQLRALYKGKGKYVLSRPMDDIFKSIREVEKKFSVDVFNITHECFLSQRTEWIEEFCKRWKKEVGKSFLIQTRVETLDPNKLQLLKNTNVPVIQVGMGIESGSQRILTDICNRQMKVERLIENYKILHEWNFRTNAYYMIGFPTETRDEVFETISLCSKVRADIDSVSIFQPYSGLPMTNIAKDKGWIKEGAKIPTFTESSIIDQPTLSSKEVANLRRTFMLYAKLPKKYWSEVKKCEDNYEGNKDLFKKLIALRWEHEGKGNNEKESSEVLKQKNDIEAEESLVQH
jgi:anaerobic magnesium-protoporphyrin IX monomethyl ester cyclase